MERQQTISNIECESTDELPYPTQEQYDVSDLPQVEMEEITEMPTRFWLEVDPQDSKDATDAGCRWDKDKEAWFYFGSESKIPLLRQRGWLDVHNNVRYEVYVPRGRDIESTMIREAAKKHGAKFLPNKKTWYVTKKHLVKYKKFWRHSPTKQMQSLNDF